jgi:hypothetical protein
VKFGVAPEAAAEPQVAADNKIRMSPLLFIVSFLPSTHEKIVSEGQETYATFRTSGGIAARGINGPANKRLSAKKLPRPLRVLLIFTSLTNAQIARETSNESRAAPPADKNGINNDTTPMKRPVLCFIASSREKER